MPFRGVVVVLVVVIGTSRILLVAFGCLRGRDAAVTKQHQRAATDG